MLNSLDRMFAGRSGTRERRRAEAAPAAADGASGSRNSEPDYEALRAADVAAAHDAEERVQAARLKRDTLAIGFLEKAPAAHAALSRRAGRQRSSHYARGGRDAGESRPRAGDLV